MPKPPKSKRRPAVSTAAKAANPNLAGLPAASGSAARALSARRKKVNTALAKTESGVARALARDWAAAVAAVPGAEASADENAVQLAAAAEGGDRRLAEYCIELLADLPPATLFAIAETHLSAGTLERRWALSQTLAQAVQKKPQVEAVDLAERCLSKVAALLTQPRGGAAAQAVLWLEALAAGSALWLTASPAMKQQLSRLRTLAAAAPRSDRDNLQVALLRLVGSFTDAWALSWMVDCLTGSAWVCFAAVEALRPVPGETIDRALWDALSRRSTVGRGQELVATALYEALTARVPAGLALPIWQALADCPAPRLAQHIGLLAALSQAHPAMCMAAARAANSAGSAQSARPAGTATDRSLTRLLEIPRTASVFTAYQACEIVGRVGDAAQAQALADLANRFAGREGFDMIAFVCTRAMRQWVGPARTRELIKSQAASGLRRAAAE